MQNTCGSLAVVDRESVSVEKDKLSCLEKKETSRLFSLCLYVWAQKTKADLIWAKGLVTLCRLEVTEQLGLEEILKTIWFHTPAMGRDTCH